MLVPIRPNNCWSLGFVSDLHSSMLAAVTDAL
jgi:hypothetical protein